MQYQINQPNHFNQSTSRVSHIREISLPLGKPPPSLQPVDHGPARKCPRDTPLPLPKTPSKIHMYAWVDDSKQQHMVQGSPHTRYMQDRTQTLSNRYYPALLPSKLFQCRERRIRSSNESWTGGQAAGERGLPSTCLFQKSSSFVAVPMPRRYPMKSFALTSPHYGSPSAMPSKDVIPGLHTSKPLSSFLPFWSPPQLSQVRIRQRRN